MVRDGAAVVRDGAAVVRDGAGAQDIKELAGGTLGAVRETAGRLRDAGPRETLAALGAVGVVNGALDALDSAAWTVLRPVLDRTVPPGVDLLPLPPQLNTPLSTLSRAVVEPIVSTGRALPDSLLAAVLPPADQLTALFTTSAAVVSRAPPVVLATAVPPPGAESRAGATGPGSVEYTSGAPQPQIRPDEPGGPGGLPVRVPAAPESAANGHVRAGGEGSPDRPTADGRSAWQPELATGAAVLPAEMKRGGRSAEADAPSG